MLCAGLTINTMAAAAINAPASHAQVAGSAFNEAASSNLMSKPAIQKRNRASDSFSSNWLQSWFNTPSTTALTYGLLFDAGSTGTRLSIFAWPARIFPHAMPNVSEPISLVYFSDRSYPGIDQPAGRAFLSELLAEAEQYLAEYTESFNTFPLYLTATAGMRKLAPQQQAIAMQDVSTSVNPRTQHLLRELPVILRYFSGSKHFVRLPVPIPPRLGPHYCRRGGGRLRLAGSEFRIEHAIFQPNHGCTAKQHHRGGTRSGWCFHADNVCAS